MKSSATTPETPKRFKRVLIANRGEIAVRIIRALRDLELESVAVYSDADADSLHRKLADYAVRLPGKTSKETYLNIPLLLDAIKYSGAEAVHPGYGFLAESAEFSKTLGAAGITFIGPTPEAMHDMGDKIAAKAIMKKAGVPVVPGSDGALRSWQDIKSVAAEIGYPLILKAAAGGGGRGMRKVFKDEELEDSFKACQREAKDYFGDDAVFCERYITAGRHIEFQVLFDEHGNGVHLFERDCSVQRRHQKLIEEAPSKFLDEKNRARLGDIAILAGKSVNYKGVGTVEFICETPEKSYFMEMNTRIQVEHPVSELVTGIDLICEQIKVAQGAALTVKQSDIKLNGWAFETRINAEDPSQGFLPSPGVVNKITLPSGPFVRVDSHLYPGYEIPNQYDSMVAKVITWGRNRDEARIRMLRALSELEVFGVPTTAKFHEAVLREEDFCRGSFDTSYLEKKMPSLEKTMADIPDHALELLAVFAAVLEQDQVSRPVLSEDSFRKEWYRQSLTEIE
jgi:acetyl-CoA carboxylase biotin carboxylase subunit